MSSNLSEIHVYVDESGDLGFNSDSSEFFILSYVMISKEDYFGIVTKTKRLMKNINTKNKKQKRNIREFKFSHDSEKTRLKFLNLIKKSNADLGIVVISKDSVKQNLKEKKPILYNYLAIKDVIFTMVNEYVDHSSFHNKISFIIDKSMNGDSVDDFNKYCESKLNEVYKQLRLSRISLDIEHSPSELSVGVQIADYLAGAVSNKISRNNSKFYDVIDSKIKHKNKWDWNDKINW